MDNLQLRQRIVRSMIRVGERTMGNVTLVLWSIE